MQKLYNYTQINNAKSFSSITLSNNYEYYVMEVDDWAKNLRPRHPNTHKYDYGKVVVIAGSGSMSGAAALVANAAITVGAGIVHLYSTTLHHATKPEIIFHKLKSTTDETINYDNKDILLSACDVANAIVIGPGLGQNLETLQLVKNIVMQNLNKIVLIDADAIGCFNSGEILSENLILTPHDGELKKIIRNNSELLKKYEDLELNKIVLAKTIAQNMNCNILLKGSTTFIASPKRMFINNYGNPGMATAGSGDVLSGLIAGCLARNHQYLSDCHDDIDMIVALASLLHSMAGDEFAATYNAESLTASDLIETISKMKY